MSSKVTLSPLLHLVVLRSRDIELCHEFYKQLGILFEKHNHGTGPDHYAGQVGEVTFEIYPFFEPEKLVPLRLGFSVRNLPTLCAQLKFNGYSFQKELHETPWGITAVVLDPENNRVELREKGE